MKIPRTCKECEKPCCTRPSLTMEEYMRFALHFGNDKMQRFEPYWREREQAWAFNKLGCPAASDHGCLIKYEDKPIVCKLFPFMALRVYADDQEKPHDELFLAVNRCPAWREFGEHYGEALEEYHKWLERNLKAS